MERKTIERHFERMGSRITIRKGTSPRGGVLRMNVATDKKGEHFTLTIHPDIEDSEVDVQVLDYDPQLKQMLLFLRYPRTVTNMERGGRVVTKRVSDHKNGDTVSERLLVGRDEMHWFVAGVTAAKNIREAFALLRPQAVTVAFNSSAKTRDWKKRKNKGFVRQGEWFFVPVHFVENKDTIIHKNEPISRPGGKPHYVEEIVRQGGETVYVSGPQVITPDEYMKIPTNQRYHYSQRVRGARVLGRGKVKHPDHHTIELKGWHEIHLSTESGSSSINAFID